MAIEPGAFAGRVREAHARIRPDIRHTRLERSETLSRLAGAEVHIKWECDQTTGSFKLRGALNKLRSLSSEERRLGVVSASTGNHGLAIGRAAGIEGVDLKLFLPSTVSEAKRAKLEKLGVALEIFGTSCEKTEARARDVAAETGRIFVSPYNDWDIVLGAGTVGLEIAEDLPGVEEVLVPVGGGGLISGIGGTLKSLRSGAVVSGVEPGTSAFMAASVRAGRIVEIEEGETVADGVAGGIEPGSITFPLCQSFVDRFLTVSESTVAEAMGLLRREHGRTVEGAGALPVAALLESPGLFRGKTVVAVVSGMNISPGRFAEITGRA
jgi:threonine dehydratase